MGRVTHCFKCYLKKKTKINVLQKGGEWNLKFSNRIPPFAIPQFEVLRGAKQKMCLKYLYDNSIKKWQLKAFRGLTMF